MYWTVISCLQCLYVDITGTRAGLMSTVVCLYQLIPDQPAPARQYNLVYNWPSRHLPRHQPPCPLPNKCVYYKVAALNIFLGHPGPPNINYLYYSKYPNIPHYLPSTTNNHIKCIKLQFFSNFAKFQPQ